MQTTQNPLGAIEAELARQDAEWREAQEQLLAVGEVELLVSEAVLDELTELRVPDAPSLPVGSTRA